MESIEVDLNGKIWGKRDSFSFPIGQINGLGEINLNSKDFRLIGFSYPTIILSVLINLTKNSYHPLKKRDRLN